jgi:hypothetical protein
MRVELGSPERIWDGVSNIIPLMARLSYFKVIRRVSLRDRPKKFLKSHSLVQAPAKCSLAKKNSTMHLSVVGRLDMLVL